MLTKSGFGACLGTSLFVLTACEAPPPAAPAPQGVTMPIVDGTRENGMDAVVSISIGSGWAGGLCTGSLIADRVVLTAKHCVQESNASGPRPTSDFRVRVGGSAFSGFDEYRVVDVVTTPGSYQEGAFLFTSLGGKDVALITLQQAPGVTPLPIKLTSPASELHQTALAVGFGETPSGQTGVKYRVDTTVDRVEQAMIQVEGTTCQGDSGGPLISSDGEVMGVTSMGSAQQCGAGGPSYFNRVDIYAQMILDAIERSGTCLSDGAEQCDGFDNDCDDLVDEDCRDNGEACQVDGDCSSLNCAETRLGKICTTDCDPSAAGACGEGFVCVADGASCAGYCVPGTLGPKMPGQACSEDAECITRLCQDPGDGDKRCLEVCRGGSGQCLAGDACVAQDGACGACVDADLIASPLGQDEPCDADQDCRSGRCLDDGGIKYCADSCEHDGECGDLNHHCRAGACVRGGRGSYGAPCVEHDDCVADFICLTTDAGRFCTTVCEDMCGQGFTCTMVNNGKICLPDGSVLGGPCDKDDECLSGVCIEDEHVCTRNCGSSADCGPGLDCVRSGDGMTGLCVAPGVDAPGGDGDGDGDGDGAGDGDGDDSDDDDGNANGDDDDDSDDGSGGGGSSGCSVNPLAAMSGVPGFLAIGILALSVRRSTRRGSRR